MHLALILTTVLTCVLWLQSPAHVNHPVGFRLLLTCLLGVAVVGLGWIITEEMRPKWYRWQFKSLGYSAPDTGELSR